MEHDQAQRDAHHRVEHGEQLARLRVRRRVPVTCKLINFFILKQLVIDYGIYGKRLVSSTVGRLNAQSNRWNSDHFPNRGFRIRYHMVAYPQRFRDDAIVCYGGWV